MLNWRDLRTATDEWYNIPTDRLRAQVLYEYKNTNYSVVNPKTIDNVCATAITHRIIS